MPQASERRWEQGKREVGIRSLQQSEMLHGCRNAAPRQQSGMLHGCRNAAPRQQSEMLHGCRNAASTPFLAFAHVARCFVRLRMGSSPCPWRAACLLGSRESPPVGCEHVRTERSLAAVTSRTSYAPQALGPHPFVQWMVSHAPKAWIV